MGFPICDELRNGSAQSADGLCTLCPSGEYKHGIGQPCRDCGYSWSSGLPAIRLFALLWAGGAFGLICWRQVARQGGRALPGRAGAQVLATLLEHTQLMAVLLLVPWSYPAGLLNVAELPASFLGADLPAMFRIDCLGSEGDGQGGESAQGGNADGDEEFVTRWLLSRK